MGIKIELTDDKIIEPSGGIAMFDLPGGEFPGNEDVLFDLQIEGGCHQWVPQRRR